MTHRLSAQRSAPHSAGQADVSLPQSSTPVEDFKPLSRAKCIACSVWGTFRGGSLSESVVPANIAGMASTLDVTTAETRARELLNARVDSVRTLVLTRQKLDDLRDQVTDAEADDARAYRAALADGWTADELKKLGVDEPAKQARVRRRAARKTNAQTAPSEPASAD